MPTPCPHFQLLRNRVDLLTEKFMKDQLKDEYADPAGFQPDLDKLAAFRLLVHAEIEDFLETKAKTNIYNISVVVAAGSPWMRQFPELLSIAYILKKAPPEFDASDPLRLTNYISDLITSAKSAIKDNHGVKSWSFTILSILSGKTYDEIDQALSSSLNSFGKNRGDVAHNSVTHSRSLQAPSSELLIVSSLVRQLELYFDAC
jgi:hypothetical protein